MAAEIRTKWRPKWLKLEENMCNDDIMAIIMDMSVRCHPEGEYRPLLSSHSWITQRPESAC